MTTRDVDVIAAGLVPVVRELFAAALAPIIARVALLESRAPVVAGRDGRDGNPGPPGRPGEIGPAGPPGSPGLVMSAAEFAGAEYDGERTVTFKFGPTGSIVVPITFPIPIYRGVFDEAKTYEPADMVTFGGHVWIAKRDTNARPSDLLAEGKSAWTLIAKRGRDGKDGRPGKDGRDGKDAGSYAARH